MRKKGTIDLTGCQSYLELHERIRVALELPEWYGKNWSAFWDVIARMSPIEDITVKGIGQANPKIQPHIEKMLYLLEKLKKKCASTPNWKFDYRVID